ncbi:erythromycin esterase family protein [Kitasatospora sp. NPDC101801]|uniref:erythromycin esterase family protein n=1 Tax=Kitasatospora sp. NPDC101801 TaxID=3364103 RepID=UPI00382DA538
MRIHKSAPALALLVAIGTTAAVVPAAAPAAAAPGASSAAVWSVPAALERAAHPLRTAEPQGSLGDLRPLGRMTGDAEVVGLGEATHGSHDFFALKHRVFRYLVEEQGFRTFALETGWSGGLRLNDYVLHGRGNLQQIMDEEFQNTYAVWNNAEYRGLLQWMRAYNIEHPGDPVQFMGDDNAFAGPELYDRVNAYAAATHPAQAPRIAELYRELRPTTDADTYITAYLARPLAERKALAERSAEALGLLEQQPSGRPVADGDDAYTWAVQHATAIDQMTKLFAYDYDDPQGVAAGMRYRDSVMAENVLWWQRKTGDKVLLSAHNGHVTLRSYTPDTHPKSQGSFLRDALGGRYVSIGTTFDRGSFNATGDDGTVRPFTLGPAEPGSTEATMDRVHYRDYLVDLRNVGPAGRGWLTTPHPTRSIGSAYSDPAGAQAQLALAESYDLAIHLHEVAAARLRTPAQDRSATRPGF